METSISNQQKTSDFFASHTFYSEEDKSRTKHINFFNKVIGNFKDGDWTCLFTLFGSEFNNAKHTSLIPFKLALERLENAIEKELKRLPDDFKWVWIAEYKYNPQRKDWRLHFHLISNHQLNIPYSGNNYQVYNIEGLASYLSKSFILSEINNIPLYQFSSSCRERISKNTTKILTAILLYSINKNRANYKEKVLRRDFNCSNLFQLNKIIYRCRGSPP